MTVFEKRVTREICQPKRDEIKRELKRLHYGELHDLHASLNIIRVIKSEGICHVWGERRSA